MKCTYYRMLKDENEMPYLAEDERTYKADKRVKYDTSEKVYSLCKTNGMTELAEEHVYALYLDTELKLISFCEVTHGSATNSLFGIREILQRALLFGATQIILTHNHPSGNTEPSGQDISATQKLKDACKIIGVILVDHLVVGKTDYTSLRTKKII